jgi:hypothetical protein
MAKKNNSKDSKLQLHLGSIILFVVHLALLGASVFVHPMWSESSSRALPFETKIR